MTTITLNGSGSSDPDGEQLEYQWTQVFGPDATGGVGFLVGVAPSFTPESVGTLIFELRVNDGHGDSPPDSVQINVLEHTGQSIFVDGDNGSDDNGDGSQGNPYATISGANNRITGPDQDIYVMSRANGASYEETETIILTSTISL